MISWWVAALLVVLAFLLGRARRALQTPAVGGMDVPDWAPRVGDTFDCGGCGGHGYISNVQFNVEWVPPPIVTCRACGHKQETTT